jgi:predicted AlkP superfamily pyrophosphatase or phosphodiesterase
MLVLWLTALILAPSICDSKAVSMQIEGEPKLVLVLLDGFRFDYADRMDPAEVPAFARLKEQGVAAEYAQSITPSMSFPSWTSIVTGQTRHVKVR